MTVMEIPLNQIRTDAFQHVRLDPAVVAEWVAYYRGEISRPSPYALFADITFIHSEGARDAIVDACFGVRGYVPVIDHHPRYGWVFHTLYGPELTWRKPCAEWFPREQVTRLASERRIEDAVCEHLRARGIPFRRQVVCWVGIADVVTAACVCEVKVDVTHHIFHALGQVLAYRAALNPVLEPVIVARGVSRRTVHTAARVGVRVLEVDQAIRNNELR